MEDFIKSLSKNPKEIKKMNEEAKIMADYEQDVSVFLTKNKELKKTKPKPESKEKTKTTKTKKLSPVEIKYKELMNTDWIPKTEKESLKRNTNDGKNATMESLLAFEDINKYMNEEISSDEEEEPKKVKENIKLTKKLDKRVSRYERNEPKFKEQEINISKEHKKLLKEGKTLSYDKDLGIVMSGKSELKKSKKGKYSVDTELNIKKGLNAKVKKGLKKSIIDELDKKIKGSGIKKSDPEYSSDDMYGRGYESVSSSDSSSDDEDVEQYSKLLKHLIGHITDKKEKIDKMDAKQSKQLINRILKKRLKNHL